MTVETMEVKVPDWVKKEKMEKKILNLFLSEILTKVEYYRSKAEIFEDKYKSTFHEAKKRLEVDKEENFEEWDDFIEWEANIEAYREWKKKYKELAECLA